MKTLIAKKQVFLFKGHFILLPDNYNGLCRKHLQVVARPKHVVSPNHNNIKCDAGEVAFKILSINNYFWTPS